MESISLHGCFTPVSDAIGLQNRLASLVIINNELPRVSYIAGVDISAGKKDTAATAGAVLMEYPSLEVVEVRTAEGRLEFPYIPGLLSFRELPLAVAACGKLSVSPDLVIVDGQGIAHPRRFGMASHLGLALGIPAIGCAKSRLCGIYEEPAPEPGSYSLLTDKDEIIGAVVRTRKGVKPVFVSPGHMIDLENAVRWVLKCCRGYRLPEPSRLAHLAAGGNTDYAIKQPASVGNIL